MMRGVAIAFPPGSVVIHGDSQKLEIKQFHLKLNLATDWLEIALANLAVARVAHEQSTEQLGKGEVGDVLVRQELQSAMQAAVAAGVFFDALYAAAKSALPQTLHASTTPGRLKGKRPAIVAEQLKRAFGLRKKGTANLQNVVTEIYRFRDAAVHPSSDFEPPALHPTLNVYVEKRFAMYTYENAKLIVRHALAYAKILPTVGLKQGPKATQELGRYLLSTCEPLFTKWEQEHGQLLETAA
ncbi:MAG: hypothetical protein KBE19_11715 [Rhodocyclaceae bacterium]|nr:hypothetical protein [Rhodocyclaceae bacterium]